MKVIDILNKMANGTLEDGFKFCFKNEVYTYTNNSIRDNYNNRIGQKRVIENYLNEEVLLFKENNAEVIEEKKEIEEKLDWEEIIGSVGKPVWDNKRKKWRVLDYYAREKNRFSVSFSDTSYTENFEEEELYFKEIKESEEK